MNQRTRDPNHLLRRAVLQIYFLLGLMQGVFVLTSLMRIPAEQEGAILFGFSPARLAILGGVLLVTLIFLWLEVKAWLRRSWLDERSSRLTNLLSVKRVWGITTIALAGIGLGSTYFSLLTNEITEPYTLAYFERLQPIAIYAAGLSGTALLALPLLRFGADWKRFIPRSGLAILIIGIFSLSLVLWSLVALTGYGLDAEAVGWNALGTPILETQVALAAGIGLLFLLIGTWLLRIRRTKAPENRIVSWQLAIDLALCGLIWAIATAFWMSIPLEPSWFAAPPRPPNFEFYPNSDALVYDAAAQTALVGAGFKSWSSPYVFRPMYAFFLFILHGLRGLGYTSILPLQVGALALFPVFGYLLAKQLHSRLAGVIFSTLLILREGNAIQLTDVITNSHSKLLMADFPTALGLILLALVVVIWFRRVRAANGVSLLAGGITGSFMLIRPEFGVVLPVIGLITLLLLLRDLKRWLWSMIFLGLGLTLALSPWVWRNWQLTGKIFLDMPNFRADLLAQRYSPEPIETDIKPEEEESYEEHAQRMAENAAEFASTNPLSVVSFTLDHYANSQIQEVLLLPATVRSIDSAIGFLGHRSFAQFWDDCCGVRNYVRRLPFWHRWNGSLPLQSFLPVLANLALISIGLAVAWKKGRPIGLVPLGFSSAYLLINALVRNSGGRYILPVDWAGILYYTIGLTQLFVWTLNYFEMPVSEHLTGETGDLSPARLPAQGKLWELKAVQFIALAVGIFLVGLLVPLAEKIVPPRYTEGIMQARLTALQAIGPDQSSSPLPKTAPFLESGGIIVQGRALYPRFYKADQGESGNWIAFLPRPYPRLSFYLVGPANLDVVMPATEQPEEFQHGTDALVFGCWSKDHVDALFVSLYSDAQSVPNHVLQRDPPTDLTCPSNPP